METIKINNIDYQIYPQNNGELILKPLHIINNLDNLNMFNFCNSQITYCKINNDNHEIYKYKSILNKIYEIIDDGSKIIKNTCLNIKTIGCTDKGFYYLKKLGISIQGVDANKCLYEIINQCIENNINLKINIKLNNNKLINVII
jgi:hypothetical protein